MAGREVIKLFSPRRRARLSALRLKLTKSLPLGCISWTAKRPKVCVAVVERLLWLVEAPVGWRCCGARLAAAAALVWLSAEPPASTGEAGDDDDEEDAEDDDEVGDAEDICAAAAAAASDGFGM